LVRPSLTHTRISRVTPPRKLESGASPFILFAFLSHSRSCCHGLRTTGTRDAYCSYTIDPKAEAKHFFGGGDKDGDNHFMPINQSADAHRTPHQHLTHRTQSQGIGRQCPTVSVPQNPHHRPRGHRPSNLTPPTPASASATTAMIPLAHATPVASATVQTSAETTASSCTIQAAMGPTMAKSTRCAATAPSMTTATAASTRTTQAAADPATPSQRAVTPATKAATATVSTTPAATLSTANATQRDGRHSTRRRRRPSPRPCAGRASCLQCRELERLAGAHANHAYSLCYNSLNTVPLTTYPAG